LIFKEVGCCFQVSKRSIVLESITFGDYYEMYD
jgi:hypothetical protein